MISREANTSSWLGSHFPLPACPYCVPASDSRQQQLLIPSDQARPGPDSLGFQHGKESFLSEAPKVTLGRAWKNMSRECRKRPWERTFLPPGAPPRQAPLGLLSVCLRGERVAPSQAPSPESPGAVLCVGGGRGLPSGCAQGCSVLGGQPLGRRTCRSSSPASLTRAPPPLGTASR